MSSSVEPTDGAPSPMQDRMQGGGAPDWNGETPSWTRLSLRLRMFLFFALIVAGGIAVIVAAAVYAGSRLDPSAVATTKAQSAVLLTAIVAAFGLLALTTWVWLMFDENVAKPVMALASELRARAHSKIERDLDAEDARYLGDLAPAAVAIAKGLSDSQSALEEAAARERERIAQERARLEEVVRDVPVGCLLCSEAHRIVLFNQQAVDLLDTIGEVGLSRDLFSLLHEGPVLAAIDWLKRSRGNDPAEFLCTTRGGERMFQARLRLCPGPAAVNGGEGYVLTLNDVTYELADHAGREMLLRDVFDQIRRPAANISSTVAALGLPETADPKRRQALQAAVVGEVKALATAITTLGQRYETRAATWWPMAEISTDGILAAVRARCVAEEIPLIASADPFTLRCDGFALARLLGDLAQRLTASGERQKITLSALRDTDSDGALFVLSWDGEGVQIGELEAWLDTPLSGGYSGLTLRDALRSHGTDLWPEEIGDDRPRLVLPVRSPGEAEAKADAPFDRRLESGARTHFYDFGLFTPMSGDTDIPLDRLEYVVFDSETTGLLPYDGDEIVQLAGVRIVNNRLLGDDRFDLLVDPGRPIPASATAIHGICEDQIRGAPTPAETTERFVRFCGDAALIAHNARFDLAFLNRYCATMGQDWQPVVLDTVLMSAILFGQSAEHSLDALAERFGVTFPEATRHTALGDALVTGDVALKMLAMLRGRGVERLSDYEREAQRHQAFLARGSTG
ncbi:MAG: exonuclease domain-containing protein [Pseudomonadota bacterium]